MLVHFLLPLRDWFIGFNLLRYITFRGGAAAVTVKVIAPGPTPADTGNAAGR